MWIVCIFIVFYVQTLVRQNKNRFLNNNVVSPIYFPDVNLLNGRSRVFNGFAWVTRAHLLILLILPHIYTERLSEKLAWLRHDSFWDLKKKWQWHRLLFHNHCKISISSDFHSFCTHLLTRTLFFGTDTKMSSQMPTTESSQMHFWPTYINNVLYLGVV